MRATAMVPPWPPGLLSWLVVLSCKEDEIAGERGTGSKALILPVLPVLQTGTRPEVPSGCQKLPPGTLMAHQQYRSSQTPLQGIYLAPAGFDAYQRGQQGCVGELIAAHEWFMLSTAAPCRLSDQPSESLSPAEGRGSSWGIQRGIVGYVESWIPALGCNFMRKRVASGREQPLEGDPILGLGESARKAIKKPDGMPLCRGAKLITTLALAAFVGRTERPGQ
ncbi:hypothetical protein QBC39DRAFT_342738 [Podospora conica]|nr:hypothetical protein QBC39DRAFT_342738 [Schizothecium conicum]